MKKGYLSEYFDRIATKRLSAVESNPESSNQHEFNGVTALKKLFGLERLTDHPVRFVWFGESDDPVSIDSTVTWYDSRENHPIRSEFRLYFRSNEVMDHAAAGDLLIVAKEASGEIIIIIAAAMTTAENQLQWLFGIPQQLQAGFEYQEIENGVDHSVDLAARFILDELEVEIHEPEDALLGGVLERFRGIFPTTAIFSSYARETLPEVSPLADPDQALLAWLEREEKLFRHLEQHVVSDRLKEGFWADSGADIDGFIRFSLSVQNRRKSRIGYALENHLEEIFRTFELVFERHAVTENRSRPDFLFPGIKQYEDESFATSSLHMLGVKSSCKDRWRQVLSEAARIPHKHLLTLEPGISVNQTSEMQANNLQLVLPKGLHRTYSQSQRQWLMGLGEFISLVSG